MLEGAADLVAYGAADAQAGRIAAADADLTSVATASAHTAGVGAGLTTVLTGLAVWGALLVGIPAVHAGSLQGPVLAVVVLVPLAAFEIVVGLPVATQSLEGVRRSATRVFAVLDTAAVDRRPGISGAARRAAPQLGDPGPEGPIRTR